MEIGETREGSCILQHLYTCWRIIRRTGSWANRQLPLKMQKKKDEASAEEDGHMKVEKKRFMSRK